MPWIQRGKKKFFYEYNRLPNGEVKKFYVGSQSSRKALEADKKEKENRLQREENKRDNKLTNKLISKLNEYTETSDLLLRSSLLQRGFYKRGSEIRNIKGNQ